MVRLRAQGRDLSWKNPSKSVPRMHGLEETLCLFTPRCGDSAALTLQSEGLAGVGVTVRPRFLQVETFAQEQKSQGN